MLTRLFLAASVALALTVPATAQASTIPYNCSACGNHNTAFDITYTLLNAAANTYELKVTAIYNAPGAGAQDYTYINAIAMKIDGVTFENGTPTLTQGPDGGPWTALSGGLSNNGCSGAGAGFFCADSTGMGAAHFAPSSPDTWKFLLDLDAPLGSTLKVHFKGHFTDANGNKVGSLISDDFWATPELPLCTEEPCQPDTPIATPEPASLVLLGAGLVFIASRVRRRQTSK